MISEKSYDYRSGTIDNVHVWYWYKKDLGAFDIPGHEWIISHKDNILKYVKNYNVVVQAGGCQGMYPRLLSDMFKTVYTFEPHPWNFHALVRNCNKENIIKINAALGDMHKMIALSAGRDINVGEFKVKESDTAHIPQLMIDDFELSECNLIMLDIESYELQALKGAEKTIKKFKPVIFVESGKDCEEYLQGLGYKPVDKSMHDTIFIAEEK